MRQVFIFLKQEYLLCWCLDGKQLTRVETVAYEHKALLAWLKVYKTERVKLVLDLIEEEFYIEKSPMLFLWEVTTYADKQCKKRFPVTSFSHVHFSGESAYPWNARSGVLTLSGFNDDNQLKKVLDWLDAFGIAVSGIYSAVFVFEKLLQEIWFTDRRQYRIFQTQSILFLVRMNADTFRQLLFVDGQLRLSRQVQLRHESLSGQLQQLLHEVNLLDKFVRSQKMLDQVQAMYVFYVGASAYDAASAWSTFQTTPYVHDDGEACFVAAEQLAPASFAEHAIDGLQVITLINHAIDTTYAPEVVQTVRSVDKGVLILWSVVFVVAMLISAYFVDFYVKKLGFQSATEALTIEKTRYTAALDALNEKMHIDLPAEQIKRSVEFVTAAQQTMHNQQMRPYLTELARILAQHQTIQLMSVAWVADPVSISGVPKTVLDATDFSIELSADIVVDNKTRLNSVLQQMEAFVSTLSASPEIAQVTVLEKPLDLDSSKLLTINADDATENSLLRFPFKVNLKFKSL